MKILIHHSNTDADALKRVAAFDDRANAIAECEPFCSAWQLPHSFDARWGIFYQTPGDGAARQPALDIRYVTNDLPAAEAFVAKSNTSANPRITRKIAAGWIYVVRELTEADVEEQRLTLTCC